MESRYHILISFVFCVSWMIAPGQEWKADMVAMNKAYLDAESFQMDITVASYVKKEDATPLMTANGKVLSANGKSYSEMMGKITLMNENCILMVDHKQRMMLYKDNTNGVYSPMNGFSLANLDSLMLMYDQNVTGTYLASRAEERRIQFQYKSGPIAKVEMAINLINNTLTEMIYYYDTQFSNASSSVEKVVIGFTNVQLNNPVDDSFFSEERFIEIRMNDVIPVSKYSSYQLINQDQVQTQ